MTPTVEIQADRVLDVRGDKCPTPIIKSRYVLNELAPGQVLKVLATDPGSITDFQGWAKIARNLEIVAQEETHEGDRTIYVHWVRRCE